MPAAPRLAPLPAVLTALSVAALAVLPGAAAVAGGGGSGETPAEPKPPQTRITGSPASPRFVPRGVFRFGSPGAASAVRFQCRERGRRWHACRSPERVRLGHGSYVFEVRAVLAGVADPTPASTRIRVLDRKVQFGESVRDRDLEAIRFGDAGARRKLLVVGQIHGDEPQGKRIVSRLRHAYRRAGGVEIWTVRSINPDGDAAGTRKNAHGVDLNRNFPVGWSGAEPPSSGYYPGPKPFSEPESRAYARLARRVRPRVTIFYHQPWNATLVPCHGKAPVERRYARLAGMRTSCRGEDAPGTAIDWQNRRLPGRAFVVELGAGRLSGHEVKRHARAALAVGRG